MLGRPAFANRAINPYNARIAERLPDHGVEVVEYRLPSSLFGRVDVVHVHWPESSFNHGLAGALLKTEALLSAIRAHRRRGARVLWTAHNLRAHERRHVEAEERFWARFFPLVDGFVALGPSSLARATEERPELTPKPAYVIPHPHYRGEYPDTTDRRSARARLDIPLDEPVVAFFGQVKAYKNLPALIELCRSMPEAHLLIAGKPRDAELAESIRTAAKGRPRTHLHLRFIPSEETQYYLRAADLLVLPYRDILNSGTALLSLSFDRPVWLPDVPLARELKDQVPGQWVHFGSMTPENLRATLTYARGLPEHTLGEHLRAFEPNTIARTHAETYRSLVGR